MNGNLIIPAVVVLISGLALQLNNIAHESSQKIIEFSADENSAVDCALKGIPISVCSPDILNDSGHAERLEAFQEFNQRLLDANQSTELTLPLRMGAGVWLQKGEGSIAVRVLTIDELRETSVISVSYAKGERETENFLLSKNPVEFDIDNDGQSDASLTVTSITETSVRMKAKLINAEIVPMSASFLGLTLLAIAVVVVWIRRQ